MSCANVVIDHDNCSHDANCGLTCHQLYQINLANEPGFVPPPGHYDDFIAVCGQFYWPNGCNGAGDFPVPTVGIFDVGAFMIGFAAVSICYFVSMPIRIASRALRSAGKS